VCVHACVRACVRACVLKKTPWQARTLQVLPLSLEPNPNPYPTLPEACLANARRRLQVLGLQPARDLRLLRVGFVFVAKALWYGARAAAAGAAAAVTGAAAYYLHMHSHAHADAHRRAANSDPAQRASTAHATPSTCA